MLKKMSLADQVASIQGTFNQNPDAHTNMEAAKFVYGIGRTLALEATHESDLIAACDALTSWSLKRAFIKGVDEVVNHPDNRDSAVAATLRPYTNKLYQELNAP